MFLIFGVHFLHVFFELKEKPLLLLADCIEKVNCSVASIKVYVAIKNHKNQVLSFSMLS